MARLRPTRAAALFGTFVLTACIALPGASASTGSPPTGEKLRSARDRLHALERRIAERSSVVDAAHAQLLESLTKLDRERQKQAQIQGQLVDLDIRLRDTQTAYGTIQARLDARAVNAYMFGPQEGLAIVLGASSAGELADRVGFVDSLTAADAELGRATARVAERLDGLRAVQARLLRSQDAVVATVRSEEQDVAATFATQAAALQDLSDARKDLVSTVAALQGRLDREEQQALNEARHGSSFESFDGWAKLLLARLGDRVCRNDRIVIVAWETAEFTKARWNPLATTHDMPGATDFNSVGVKNYVSLEQGLQATIETLRLGKGSYGYGAILDGLANCDDPMTTALAINASAWCHGCAGGRYVIAVVPSIEAYFDDHGL